MNLFPVLSLLNEVLEQPQGIHWPLLLCLLPGVQILGSVELDHIWVFLSLLYSSVHQSHPRVHVLECLAQVVLWVDALQLVPESLVQGDDLESSLISQSLGAVLVGGVVDVTQFAAVNLETLDLRGQ